MMKIGVYIVLFSMAIVGCTITSEVKNNKDEIVKVVDFEISPDEEKVVFSVVTPIGNTDIWVVDIDGSNLKRLTFKDRSPSNHIARFFRKHKWRNFFEVDMLSPKWTKDGRIAFCQELTKHDIWGLHTVSLRYWTIEPNGLNKRPEAKKEEIVRRKPFSPIHSFEMSDYSDKHKKKIFLKDDTLWFLNNGETDPKKLLQ